MITRVCIVLLVALFAFAAVACRGDDASTTTSVALSAEGASQSSPPGEVGGGTQPPESPPDTPPTPPSLPLGQSTPPQPGQEYAEKLPQLEQAVRENPNDLEALAELAIAYYQTQAYVDAEATYKRMIAIDDRAEFHNNLANVYRDWQKTDEAIAHYEKAIELDPTSALSYGNLAAMYLMNGDAEQAKNIARRGIENTAGAGRDQLEALLARM